MVVAVCFKGILSPRWGLLGGCEVANSVRWTEANTSHYNTPP
jgi:hypothetical protein